MAKNTPSFISYESSLGKFITGALMPLVIDDANLLIIVTPSKNSIGGYKFQFLILNLNVFIITLQTLSVKLEMFVNAYLEIDNACTFTTTTKINGTCISG